MAGVNDEQMRREVGELLKSARGDELEPSEFAARLASLHGRLLPAAADTRELVRRRRDASRAYGKLAAGTDIERHHNLELLAHALDVSSPAAP